MSSLVTDGPIYASGVVGTVGAEKVIENKGFLVGIWR
jgi:hypothetical protein